MSANREPKTVSQNFTRGSEIWWHQANLFFVAARNALVISLVVGLAVLYVFMSWKAKDHEVRQLMDYSWASIWDEVGLPQAYVNVVIQGEVKNLPANTALEQLRPLMGGAKRAARNGALVGLLSALGVFVVFVAVMYASGKRKMQDFNLRGSALVEGQELREMLVRNADASPYSIAGVPVRRNAETLHFLIAGGQGTGKSQLFFGLMDQVKSRGKRAIIFDPSGEFTATYYREGRDVIMNPLDQRSPYWTPWNDIKEEIHFDNIVNGLLSDPPGQNDPFWTKAGRNVMKDVMRVLKRDGNMSNRALYEAISLNGLEELNTLLEGTPGATYTAPETERTGMSLKMTVQNQLECFKYLPDVGQPFSIRDWIAEEGDSWMFISTREAQMDAIRPLLSLWVYIAIQAVLDLEPIHRERLWFMLDEFPRLQKMDTMELALTNTRKYGLCMVLGVQDFGQLREKYGPNLTQTIVSQCQTKAVLRSSDGQAARALAQLLGQAEMDEKEETMSYGVNSQRDGVSVSTRRHLRDIVLSSEILYLPDMAGYLTTPGPYPIAKIQYGYTPRAKNAPSFVPREGVLEPVLGPVGAESASKPNGRSDGGKEDGGGEGVDLRPFVDAETGVILSDAQVAGLTETTQRSQLKARVAKSLY